MYYTFSASVFLENSQGTPDYCPCTVEIYVSTGRQQALVLRRTCHQFVPKFTACLSEILQINGQPAALGASPFINLCLFQPVPSFSVLVPCTRSQSGY